MLLEHPSLDPFQPLIRELFDSTFGKALRGLAAAGLKPGDEWHTQAGFVFRAACLPVFGSTQQRVGAMVLDAERRIVVLEAEEAHAQSKKDSSIGEIKSLRSILQNRQLVLRRFMDGILWVLVWPYPWILRRLRVDGGIKRIAPETLEPLLEVVTTHNAKRDNTFSIICDLTTTAQLGDLIIAVWLPSRNVTKIVVAELKVGPMNVLLRERLHQPNMSDVKCEIAKIAVEIGKKQLSRRSES